MAEPGSLHHLSAALSVNVAHCGKLAEAEAVRLRNITDPDFKNDYQTEGQSEEEQKDSFSRKAAELKRVNRELVDKNPAQYGRFSERVMEIIRRFEEDQIAAGEGLKAFEDLTGGIEAEGGAHTKLGMDERAFAILRIMEPHAPDAPHKTLQAVAVEVGGLYAAAQASQPSWFFMDATKGSFAGMFGRCCARSNLATPMPSGMRLRTMRCSPVPGRTDGHGPHRSDRGGLRASSRVDDL